MKALIISGGKVPSEKIFKEEIKDSDLLIAADKGVEAFIDFNIKPDYALGDFDSIKEDTKALLSEIEVIKFNPEKDNTDSEIAFLKAIELGAKEIALLGFTGTRLDHTIANIGLLKIALKHNVKAYIRDDNNLIYLTDKGLKLRGKKGQYISFQAFGEDVLDFSIKNSKYPLNKYNLTLGDGRCVSNEFLEGDMEINFKRGLILVMYSND